MFKLAAILFSTIVLTIASCQVSPQGSGSGTVVVTYSGVPTFSPPPSPSPTPTMTMTPTPGPQATMPYTVMIGQDFACGSTSNGSLANPNAASPPLNANASAALKGKTVIVIVDQYTGTQSTPYAPNCTPPSTWNVQYLLRFASYSDLYAAATTPGVLPTTAPGVPLFKYLMYDNEPHAQPTTNPSELPTNNPGQPSVPGYYYYEASQAVAALPGHPIFMATAGTSGNNAQDSVMYATAGYWGAFEAQIQQSGSTVSNWTNSLQNFVGQAVPYNNTMQIFVGVGQVLAVGGGTLATQAQLDAVMAAVPPNFNGVWMNLNQQTTQSGNTIPNGYALGAQAIVDTANGGITATPYPFPTSTTAATPPPAPSASPTIAPTSPPPQVAATLCIGQTDGTGKQYNLKSHDEFNQDTVLNTASPMPSALNVSDVYPAASPPSVGSGVVQTTWSVDYSFGQGTHTNPGLAGADDSVYPPRSMIATWQSEYGAASYPYTVNLLPGIGVQLLEYPDSLYHPTAAAAYTVASPTLAANYTAGGTTVTVSSATGIAVGQVASIFCSASSCSPHQYQFDPNYPIVTAISGTTVTLSGTGFSRSYSDAPTNAGSTTTQTIVFSPTTVKLSSVANLVVGQAATVVGSRFDNKDVQITAINTSTNTITISPGFVVSHPIGEIIGIVPQDVETAACADGECRHVIAGLMDGNINNAYEYGYWVYGTLSVPDGSTAYQGDFPSDWTLCETTCNPSGNNYYEMDTFEIYSTLFGQGNGHQSLQPENAGGSECDQTNPQGGCSGPTYTQYYPFSDTAIATTATTWSEVSTGTPGTATSGNVWFMHNNQPALALPLAQVPAANSAANPGVNPIMVQQSCSWGGYCAPGVNPTASPLAMIEQYYRHYAPTTTTCGPPYDVPPPPSPTPVPTAPPTTNPAIAPQIAATSAAAYNSTGYAGTYGVLGTASGTTGSVNSTSGDTLVAVASMYGNITVPTGWTALTTTTPIGIFWCKVGSGAGQCPVANSWNFGGDNHGGLTRVYEFSNAGTPTISANSQQFLYGTQTTATVTASKTISATNGLTLVVSSAMLAGATTTLVNSMTDSITGGLTEGASISNYDANVITGSGNSIATLRTFSIDEDAGLSGIQPVINNQAEVTSTGAGIAFGNYFVYIPHS